MESENAAEARREARRRRILQNSDERLRKIKGEAVEIEPAAVPNEHRCEEDVHYSKNQVNREDQDIVTDTQEPPQYSQPDDILNSTAPVDQTTSISKLSRTKVHIVLLALAVRLCLFLNMGYLFADAVLVPLLVMQITLLLVPGGLHSANGGGGLLGAALMLSGITQSKAHGLLSTACYLRNICTDLALYLFTFLLAHFFFLQVF